MRKGLPVVLTLPLKLKKNREAANPVLKEEWRQVKVLVKHFVTRFINNDSLEFENQRTEYFVFGLVFLAIWGGYIAKQSEKFFFMTLMMTLTAIFCVVTWDNIFLDNKDYLNLTGLPVKGRTLYMGKFLSVLVVVGIFSLAFSLIAGLMYTYLEAQARGIFFIYYWLSLLLTNFLANLSVFLLVAAVQGLLMFIFSGKILVKISLFVQVILLLGLASVFVWFPKMNDAIPGLSSTFSPAHYYFPPLWFNGLHEKILGGSAGIYSLHFYLAMAALIVPMVIYGLSLPLSSRSFRRPGSGKKNLRRLIYKPLAPLRRRFNALFLSNSLQRAVFYFFIKTLKRSRKQKLYLALIMALPVGFVLTYMVILYNRIGESNFKRLDLDMIAFPFILYFFLIFALRTLVERPVCLDSNWIFKITCRPDISHYLKGVKKAIFFYSILPLSLFLFTFYFYFWEFKPAFSHFVYSLTTALLLMEVFFIDYRRIPFATRYNPGSVNFKLVWPLYVILFLVYYFIFIRLGLLLLMKPRTNLTFYIIMAIIFPWFRRHRNTNKDMGLIFDEAEEELNPVMLSLNLSS